MTERSLVALDLDDLIFPFNDMVGNLQDQVDRARSASVATSTAFDLMPQTPHVEALATVVFGA